MGRTFVKRQYRPDAVSSAKKMRRTLGRLRKGQEQSLGRRANVITPLAMRARLVGKLPRATLSPMGARVVMGLQKPPRLSTPGARLAKYLRKKTQILLCLEKPLRRWGSRYSARAIRVDVGMQAGVMYRPAIVWNA